MTRLRKIYLLLLVTIASCNVDWNNEKARMIKGLSKTYIIDKNTCDYTIFENFGIDNLELILSENGTYHLKPSIPILKGYDGRWDLSGVDSEFGNFIFSYQNGNRVVTDLLNINFIYRNKKYTFCFTDIKYPQNQSRVSRK